MAFISLRKAILDELRFRCCVLGLIIRDCSRGNAPFQSFSLSRGLEIIMKQNELSHFIANATEGECNAMLVHSWKIQDIVGAHQASKVIALINARLYELTRDPQYAEDAKVVEAGHRRRENRRINEMREERAKSRAREARRLKELQRAKRQQEMAAQVACAARRANNAPIDLLGRRQVAQSDQAVIARYKRAALLAA